MQWTGIVKTIILRSIGVFGVVLFAALFALTFLSQETIEESAKGFVGYQIEKEVRETYENTIESSLVDSALIVAERLGFEREGLQADLENKLPEKIASFFAVMCGYDCEKKKALTESITTGYLERITNIEVAEDTLGNIIRGKYVEIVGNLKTDLRIFLGSNFFAFLLVLLVSFFKPNAIAHLFLPTILLFVATMASSAIYIFGQDWFYTILYNDYMGFAYLIDLAIIFAFLVDIVINYGRITTEVVNFFFNAIGSAFSVVPC